ncbi:TetR/AcrR family transcriptional regulator [Phyllobacterium lublinensis]|uniref:TetR/AcrR family transcriptional regulator n=1 Tax=Phyllobacterium lublinensis TaxID=2875708 RepID=UPI001CCCA96F|nr:TetR/AcrR family transcriptional regulator [Phyllobacterium sp. 2063]MBZ9655294.1 TetR/AcrR family transcriptional regulator [Phyllobacterium sp. 2063]
MGTKGPPPELQEIELSPPARPLRADASRNREKLVEIAGIVFAQHGGDASLENIARQAGVGIGTLYRHFPTREHLVEVVYRREVEALCAAADELAQHNAPDVALAEWMQRFVDYIAAKRGMANSLRILFDANSDVFANTAGMVTGALRGLVAAAIADGSIRSDIDSSDVLQALSGIYSSPDTPDWRERSRRIVSLLMDGLRWGAAKPRS